MYNSPATKLVKDVFNDNKNFELFYNGFRSLTNNTNMTRKHAEEVYKILRNEIRDRFKNLMKNYEYNLVNDDVKKIFSNAMESSINDYIQEIGRLYDR